MLSLQCPQHSHSKGHLTENENTVNLKSGVSVLNMLLNEGLTRVHSQKDPRLHFGESQALSETTTAMPLTDSDCYSKCLTTLWDGSLQRQTFQLKTKIILFDMKPPRNPHQQTHQTPFNKQSFYHRKTHFIQSQQKLNKTIKSVFICLFTVLTISSLVWLK